MSINTHLGGCEKKKSPMTFMKHLTKILYVSPQKLLLFLGNIHIFTHDVNIHMYRVDVYVHNMMK